MDAFTNIVNQVDGFIWGPVMLVLLLGTGFYLTLGLKGMNLPPHRLRIPHAVGRGAKAGGGA